MIILDIFHVGLVRPQALVMAEHPHYGKFIASRHTTPTGFTYTFPAGIPAELASEFEQQLETLYQERTNPPRERNMYEKR